MKKALDFITASDPIYGRRTHLGSRIQLKGKKPNRRKIAAKKSAAKNLAKAGGRATLAAVENYREFRQTGLWSTLLTR